MGFCDLPILFPHTAAMEEDPEDEEDPGPHRDSPSQGDHHQSRPHGQQDQG